MGYKHDFTKPEIQFDHIRHTSGRMVPDPGIFTKRDFCIGLGSCLGGWGNIGNLNECDWIGYYQYAQFLSPHNKTVTLSGFGFDCNLISCQFRIGVYH